MNRVLFLFPVVGVLGVVAANLGPALAYETRDCIRCHGEGASESRLHVSADVFGSSVHGGKLECLDCHAEEGDERHLSAQTVRPVDCSPCHDQVNRHGEATAAGGLPGCHDCHTRHAMFPPLSPLASVHPENLNKTCSSCHPGESGQLGTWMSAAFFRLSAHRKGDLSGVFDARRCVDCHQGKAAHGEENPLNEARCWKCHGSSPKSGLLLGTFHGASIAWRDPGALAGQSYYAVLLVAGLSLFCFGLRSRKKLWQAGRAEERKDLGVRRLFSLLKFGLAQRKVFEDRLAGLSHLCIVAGFVVPLAFVVAVQFSFEASPQASKMLGLLLDLSGLSGMIGVALFALRRARRQRAGLRSFPGDWMILLFFFGAFLSGFLVGAMRISLVPTGSPAWTPVRFFLSSFVPADPVWAAYLWRIHFLLVLGLVAFLPYSKLRHIVTGPLNVYYRNFGQPGTARSLVLKRGLSFGASSWQDFTWKQLLDADACMKCGRCEDRCPAAASGKPLSPQKVMRALGAHMEHQGSLKGFGEKGTCSTGDLLGKRVTEEEVWACTTCHACQAVCPVFVEPVRVLLDLRRHLVLEQARFPSELKGVFRKMEVYGNPYGKGPARRTEWARDRNAQHVAPEKPVDYLLWVGCEAAFHERNRPVARALVTLLTKAGLDFGILGKRENCCGDLARRVGNEYLFQKLAKENIERLKGLRFQHIVTLCPHCFHTLKNEYPQFGGQFSVVHSSELLSELIGQGRLRPERPVSGKATFHDPCYLGRVNGSYQAGRKVLRSIPGLEMMEMERSLDRSFCCGAGGGRMWMHEQPGQRMNRLRAGEALALRVEYVVTSCPYCLGMFEEGMLAAGGQNLPRTMDLAEVVLESMGDA
jgi:Fe-S oxidoreductase/nitrate reductase gamma subunit